MMPNRPTLDGFSRPTRPAPKAAPQPVVRTPDVPKQPAPALNLVQDRSKPKGKKMGRWQLIVILTAGVAAGLILQIFPLGYLAVFAYAAVALVKRIPSRITFMIAVGTLLLSPLGIAVGSAAMANGFSLMSFLLLSVGAVTLAIELNKERRSKT